MKRLPQVQAFFASLLLSTYLLPLPAAHADLAYKANSRLIASNENIPPTAAVAAPSVGSVPVTAPAASAKPAGDPFPLSSKFSRRVQRYTGVNWLSGFIASHTAGYVIKRKLGGKVKVRVKTYSMTDLMAGKLKSVSLEIRDPHLKGIGLGEVTIKSANPIWYAYRKPKDGTARGFKCPVILCVKASLSQKQIAAALENPAVVSKLHGLKLDMPGLGEQQLEVVKPKVEILDDLLKLEGTLVTKGGDVESGVPVTISARPKLIGDSQIVLDSMKVDSPDIIEPEKFADFTSKLLNPVVDFSRMDRRDHAFRLDSLRVSGKKGDLEGDGRLLLVPKPSGLAGTQMAQKKGALTQ